MLIKKQAPGSKRPPLNSRNLRHDNDVARSWPDNVERAARGNNETENEEKTCRID